MTTTQIGKPYRTTDRIEWQIERTEYVAVYPYRHHVVSFDARPTESGRDTDAYRAMRRELGDDWSLDLTNSEYITDHLIQAGLSESEASDVLASAHALRMEPIPVSLT